MSTLIDKGQMTKCRRNLSRITYSSMNSIFSLSKTVKKLRTGNSRGNWECLRQNPRQFKFRGTPFLVQTHDSGSICRNVNNLVVIRTIQRRESKNIGRLVKTLETFTTPRRSESMIVFLLQIHQVMREETTKLGVRVVR